MGLVLLLTWSDSPDGKSKDGFVGGVRGCFNAAGIEGPPSPMALPEIAGWDTAGGLDIQPARGVGTWACVGWNGFKKNTLISQRKSRNREVTMKSGVKNKPRVPLKEESLRLLVKIQEVDCLQAMERVHRLVVHMNGLQTKFWYPDLA